jgi:predicted Zn-dependent peptidase
MEHLDTATGRFQGIQQKILYPNNAVLVVAGDLKSCYQRMEKYFGQIKRQKIEKQNFIEEPITQTLKQLTRSNIQILCWWHHIERHQ